MNTMVRFLSICVVAIGLPASGSLIVADELLFPAAQIEQGKGSVSVYLNRSFEKLSLQVRDRAQITVGGLSYFSTVSNDFEAKGRSNAIAARVMVNPWSGFYYWLKAGSGSYELEIPSVTVNNTLSGQDNGIILGIGARKLLIPDTIVTPAIAVDLGVNYRKYNFNALRPDGGAKALVSNILEMADIQAAAIVSKKFNWIEPYGALRVTRTYLSLKDAVSLGKVDGSKDDAGIVLGARVYLHPRESLVVEGQVSEGTSLTAGWNVQF